MNTIDLKSRLNHIVVATNLSEGARRAHAHAAALATAFEARVTLLHVDEFGAGSGGEAIDVGDYMATLTAQREARLSEAVADISRHGVPVEVKVVAGLPKTAIDKWVRAHGGDLVVMTKRNRGPIQEALLGSTTQRVLRLVSTPILVVHEQDKASDSAALPNYKHIMTASDLSDMADRGLRATLSIADATQSMVTFVHVLRMPKMVPLGASGMASAGGMPQHNLNVHRSTAEAHISKILRELDDERVRPLILVDNNAGEAISGAADTENVDLITIPTAGRTGLKQILLGSTAERVARLASKPVLVFPRPFLERFSTIDTDES